MSLGLARRKELQKRRSQRLWMMMKFIFLCALIGGTAYFSYDTGQEIAKQNYRFAQDKYDQLEKENQQLIRELGSSKAALEQMQSLVPNDQVRDLLQVVSDKSAEGVAVERMARLVGGMTTNEACGTESEVKRFVVTTLVNTEKSNVSFERGLITISGSGSPTLNEEGNPEAWFDPTKPVTLTFTLPGGETQEISGILPLHHSIVQGDKEYRFSMTPGRRSFVDVTLLTCSVN
ncbi:hypothetical protein [Emcibacter nanhaiensis]|uniref:Uncharacterized protein n=1 Tax=Emcibacter nanhaiensis TaxID=1505037 RepID=A0A501PD33_9PROT|nr:hypothetical protein [Emcibacter nanhaiensis]TPD57814.1 hypothetical protein FIV46_17070 [Emcibacter nanhaiensis]